MSFQVQKLAIRRVEMAIRAGRKVFARTAMPAFPAKIPISAVLMAIH